MKNNNSEPVDNSRLCDGCNVHFLWEHHCYGAGCTCDNPECVKKQGHPSDENSMKELNNLHSRLPEDVGSYED